MSAYETGWARGWGDRHAAEDVDRDVLSETALLDAAQAFGVEHRERVMPAIRLSSLYYAKQYRIGYQDGVRAAGKK